MLKKNKIPITKLIKAIINTEQNLLISMVFNQKEPKLSISGYMVRV